jgi:hypothetical protein
MGGIGGSIRRCGRFRVGEVAENNSRSPAGMTTKDASPSTTQMDGETVPCFAQDDNLFGKKWREEWLRLALR